MSSCGQFPIEKQRFINEFELGDDVADIFILTQAQQSQSKNGPYWRLEFSDSSGSMGGKIWSPKSQAYPDLAAGQMVFVKAKVSSYRDELELSAIDGLRAITDAEKKLLNISDFMPASPYKQDDMFAELQALCKKHLSYRPWKKFISSLFEDEEIKKAFCSSPAAKSMHHAYASGLLEHSLSVARLSMLIAQNYPETDRQLLLCAAICHDLGKCWEYTSDMVIDYTTAGRLIGHINLVMEKLAPFLKKSKLDDYLVEHFHHLILSHHGEYEYGAPKLPATAEALILHYADNIDAKLQQLEASLSHIPKGEAGWSAWIPSMQRSFYQPMRTPEESAAEKEKTTEKKAASGKNINHALSLLQLPGMPEPE